MFYGHRELCQQMMQHSPGVEHDDVLKELIGFLEACRPRMVELIEYAEFHTAAATTVVQPLLFRQLRRKRVEVCLSPSATSQVIQATSKRNPDAGMVGELEPELLESCLKLNDALLRTLTAERTHTQLEVEKLDLGLPPTPKGSSTPKNTTSQNLLDFSPDAAASTAGYTKSKLGNSSGFTPAPPAFAIADSFDDEPSG
eukprot:4520-Heterococcus_DN1.PRE.1